MKNLMHFMNKLNGGLFYIQELKKGKIRYLDMLYDTIILKNVVKPCDVKDIDFLERLVDFLIENMRHYSQQTVYLNLLNNIITNLILY